MKREAGPRAVLVGPLARKHDKLLKRIRLNSHDLLIGVDGGAERLLDSGIRPTICVGDWDSVSSHGKKKILARERHLTLSREKDRSDLYYAFQLALHFGAREIVALGFAGGRVDHQLGVLYEFAEVADGPGAPASLSYLSEKETVHFLSRHMDPLSMKLKKGTLASVFSLLGIAAGVRLEGFRFSLKKRELRPSSHGLSNVAAAQRQTISINSKGVIAVILPLGSRNAGESEMGNVPT